MTRIVVLLSVSFLLLHCNPCPTPNPGNEYKSSLQTNEAFVRNLYTGLDRKKPKAVFNHIYELLPEEVTVYPSENVYYFRFQALGKTMDGTITLYAHQRDSGLLGFGYVQRMEFKSRQKDFPIEGGFHDFTNKDSLQLKKQNDYTYTVDYRGKRVVFKLHQLSENPPEKMKLTQEEELVSPTFDESGLQFYLVFNKKAKRLFWVLNEDEFVPESFHPVGKHLVAGDRTEFVFFNDSIHKRKILVGVEGENVMQNNCNLIDIRLRGAKY